MTESMTESKTIAKTKFTVFKVTHKDDRRDYHSYYWINTETNAPLIETLREWFDKYLHGDFSYCCATDVEATAEYIRGLNLIPLCLDLHFSFSKAVKKEMPSPPRGLDDYYKYLWITMQLKELCDS